VLLNAKPAIIMNSYHELVANLLVWSWECMIWVPFKTGESAAHRQVIFRGFHSV